MAFKHVTAVIESWLPAAEKLVALAIAESANRDDDQCWLSLERIAQRASCSVRGAQKVIQRLQQQHIVARVGKKTVARGYVWIFQLYIEHLPMDMPEELRGEPSSPVTDSSAEARTPAASQEATPSTGERRSPVTTERGSGLVSGATGERKDVWGEPGSGVRVNEGGGRGEPGSGNPILKNQVSETVPSRAGPGLAPGRPSGNPEEAESRVANSAARTLGIPTQQPGEPLARFNARIGDANLARLEEIRRTHVAGARRETSVPFPDEVDTVAA